MSIKFYRPTTPSRRQMSVSGFDGVDKKAKPERSLTEVKKKHSGAITMGILPSDTERGKSQVHNRLQAQKEAEEATVLRLEYD